MDDDDQQKRPLDPSDFDDDFYDDEFAFDENDPELAAELPPLTGSRPGPVDPHLADPAELPPAQEFEDTPENWGDFEDPALSAAKPGALPGGLPQKPKSFFMKNFNMIVIGAGILLGVGVMGSQFMGSPSGTPASDMAPLEGTPDIAAVDPSMAPPETAPPQPSPIAPAPEAPADMAQADQQLTPLPDPAAPATPNDGLSPLDPGPDLGLDAVGVKEGPQEMASADAQQLEDPSLPPPIEAATDVGKPAVELPDPIAFENQPIPTAAPPAPEAPPAEAPEVVATAEMPAPAPAEEAPVTPATPADPPQMAASQDTLPAPEAPAPAEAPVAAPAPTDSAAPAPVAPALDETAKAELTKLNADNEELSSRNEALENEIKGANSKIEELAAMLAEMEKKIAALETAPAAAKAEEPIASAPDEPAQAPEEKIAEAPAEETTADNVLIPAKPTERPDPPPAKKPTAKKPAPAPKIATDTGVDSPRWVLRSAQTGRAVVSDRSTGDLRSVQVGDTLRGIGSIQSISSVNGRWVVQGSQGQVRQ